MSWVLQASSHRPRMEVISARPLPRSRMDPIRCAMLGGRDGCTRKRKCYTGTSAYSRVALSDFNAQSIGQRALATKWRPGLACLPENLAVG